MAFTPNTTIYLCAGTGMDAGNSIWWHRFAYPSNTSGDDESRATWWNTCFQFFKSHAIAEGNWYCTYLDPSRGYFRFGRNPLVNRSIDPEQSEAGLGNAGKQDEILNGDVNIADVIRAVDYLIFSNDGGDVTYAFVDRIESINWNTCNVYFTVDAIMTYQSYFYLGPCRVERDMEFQERMGSDHGYQNIEVENTQPEPIEPQETDYVFQRVQDLSQTIVERLNYMGPYGALFCTSDVSLVEDDITPNPFYGGLPSFKACDASMLGQFNLGIGGYYVPRRNNEVFDLLGSYNAIEHVLYSYTVPMLMIDWDKLPPPYGTADYAGGDDSPIFIEDYDDIVDEYFKPTSNEFDDAHTLRLPIDYNDEQVINDCSPQEGNYQPVNLKVYQAPYSYLAISDRQGNSMEVLMQDVISYTPSEEYYYRIPFQLYFSPAPNVMSSLWITQLKNMRGSVNSPMLINMQLPSYIMTPNNSGYNNNAVSAWTNLYTGAAQIVVGVPMSIAGQVGASLGDALGPVVAAGTGGALLPFSGQISDVMSSPGKALNMAGGGFIGSGVSALSAGVANVGNYFQNKAFGLPKAVGGIPNGYTTTSLAAGITFFWVHMRTKLIKNIDRYFSTYGYSQNAFRYPHINIRKRWCYVKLQTVNMIPMNANNFTPAGVPFWARQQIEERLKNGVTFWNVRHALMGDADSGRSTVQSYDDPAITAANKCQFVKNYGGGEAGNDIEWENVSYFGGYASDYSDDYNPNE